MPRSQYVAPPARSHLQPHPEHPSLSFAVHPSRVAVSARVFGPARNGLHSAARHLSFGVAQHCATSASLRLAAMTSVSREHSACLVVKILVASPVRPCGWTGTNPPVRALLFVSGLVRLAAVTSESQHAASQLGDWTAMNAYGPALASSCCLTLVLLVDIEEWRPGLLRLVRRGQLVLLVEIEEWRPGPLRLVRRGEIGVAGQGLEVL